MRWIISLIIFSLLLSACEKRLSTDVPVEEILKGPSLAKAPEPAPQVPVIVEKPVEVNKTPVVEEKPPEKGSIMNIDVLIRSKASTVDVIFEHGEEKFNLDNADKDLIIGILVGKYSMTEQKTRELTTFLQEAGTEPVVNATTQQSQPPAPTQSKVVELKAYSFVPEVLNIQKNTAVVWIHKDLAPHTVTSSGGSESFDSGTLQRDQTFTYTFRNPGTYDYYCTIHPSMRGKVVVQ